MDHEPVLFRQLAQDLVQLLVLGLRHGDAVVQGHRPADPPGAQVALAAVHRHPQQPGPAVLLGCEGRTAAEVAQEDLLADVLGVGPGPGVGIGQPEDHRLIPVHGLLQLSWSIVTVPSTNRTQIKANVYT